MDRPVAMGIQPVDRPLTAETITGRDAAIPVAGPPDPPRVA